VGYEQLTIDAVAARARASKATIYRRWDDKRELVISAMERTEASHPDMPGDAGSLREDLLALARLLRDIAAGEDARVFSGLLYVSQRDPVIARVLRDQLVERRRADCRDVVQRAIGRGELPAHQPTDLLFELMIGHVMVRSVLQGRQLDDGDLTHLVDEIVMPVLKAGAEQ
jgi:AcrR family transcriptional regulator